MQLPELSEQAMCIGRQRASDALSARAAALSRRAKALALRGGSPPHAAAHAVPAVPALSTLNALVPSFEDASGSAGLLLAEGDSWFDYPLYDVLDQLDDDHGYEIERLSRAGDRIEAMAYSGGQLETLSRRLESLLRHGRVPRALLLSGGGNDLAGPEFGMLLNHAASKLPGLNEQALTGVIDQRIRAAYTAFLAALSTVCQHWLGRPLPIIVHGYDYPVPDGRGVLGGSGPLPGPWLEPGFLEKGYGHLSARKAIARQLIDRFNVMLAEVSATPDFNGHVHYLDLRGTLSSGTDYREDWGNEMHPTRSGFGVIADRFAGVLESL